MKNKREPYQPRPVCVKSRGESKYAVVQWRMSLEKPNRGDRHYRTSLPDK